MAHIQMSRDWIFGLAQGRGDLGHRTAARLVWMSLPWLAIGTGWSGIHALLTPGAEAFLLKEVLLAHIAALLIATSLCHLTRRLPPSFPCRWGVFFLLVVVLGGGGGGYLASQDYDAGDHALLLLALIGAAVLTVLLGGRALAQAEVLTEVSAIPGWRKRKR